MMDVWVRVPWLEEFDKEATRWPHSHFGSEFALYRGKTYLLEGWNFPRPLFDFILLRATPREGKGESRRFSISIKPTFTSKRVLSGTIAQLRQKLEDEGLYISARQTAMLELARLLNSYFQVKKLSCHVQVIPRATSLYYVNNRRIRDKKGLNKISKM